MKDQRCLSAAPLSRAFSKSGCLMVERLDAQALKRALHSPEKEERIKAVRELGTNRDALKKATEQSSCPETRFAAKAYHLSAEMGPQALL